MLKLSNLKLARKFTLLLLVVFLGGILSSSIALAQLLNYSTQAELTSKALMLMEAMNSVRTYTNSDITPELVDRLDEEFLPAIIPAYSAREVFERLRENSTYSDFFYKEAALNPTNLRDKADAFETDIIEKFRREAKPKEVSGFRRINGDDKFYIARPIKIKQSSCLECHSTPENAPPSMVERYGPDNGFNWQLNEIIGAQVLSVPASKIQNNARRALAVILGIFALVFAIAIFFVNLWLKRYVVRPLNRMASTAEAVSTGEASAEFVKFSNDEVGNLTDSFNRMRLSLQMSMQRLERYRSQRRSGSNDFSEGI